MVAGCGPKIAKLFLFIFNFSIWAVGVALITVGSYVTAQQADYQDLFSEDTLVIVCALTISIGCFTFIVGFCGCCGAMKESVCLLKTYWFLMLLIICGKITAGVLAFVYNDQIDESMLEGMTATIYNTYPDTEASTEAIDGVQKASKCCGAKSFTDYMSCTNCDDDKAVPESCCIEEDADGNFTLCRTGVKGVPLYPLYVYQTLQKISNDKKWCIVLWMEDGWRRVSIEKLTVVDTDWRTVGVESMIKFHGGKRYKRKIVRISEMDAIHKKKQQGGTPPAEMEQPGPMNVGCVEAYIDMVQDNFILVGAICFALLVFEILTMVFTCCVIDGIPKDLYA